MFLPSDLIPLFHCFDFFMNHSLVQLVVITMIAPKPSNMTEQEINLDKTQDRILRTLLLVLVNPSHVIETKVLTIKLFFSTHCYNKLQPIAEGFHKKFCTPYLAKSSCLDHGILYQSICCTPS